MGPRSHRGETGVVRLALEAMATRFELVLHGDDPVRLRAAGEEALREISRLEDILSFYRPAGALGTLNRSPPGEPVRVPTALFDLLVRARGLWERTGGAFDPTVGPLMKCWGMVGGPMRRPTPDRLAQARDSCGFERVLLDVDRRTVRFEAEGMAIDLGGIAKGFAIDEAIELLAEFGVAGALLHGGTSTVASVGVDPRGDPWRIGIPDRGTEASDPASDPILCTVDLAGASLSVSEVRGKGFEDDDGFHGHIMDPRSGKPTRAVDLAAVRAYSATESDALATALLVLGAAADETGAFLAPDVSFLSASWSPSGRSIVGRGLFSDPDVR